MFGRKVARKQVISPMVEDRARTLATELGIEVYSDAEGVALWPLRRGGRCWRGVLRPPAGYAAGEVCHRPYLGQQLAFMRDDPNLAYVEWFVIDISGKWVGIRYVAGPVGVHYRCAAAETEGRLLLVQHREFLSLDMARLAAVMARPFVLDTRNVLAYQAWEAAGFEVLLLGAASES